jgi:hypothetical protein
MSETLFLRSVTLEEGQVLLRFAVGAPVALSEGRKVRDLGDGCGEYEMTVSRDDARFTVRVVAAPSGSVEQVVAAAGPIDEDWHQTREE